MSKKTGFLYTLAFAVVSVSLLLTACKREYNFNFEDGTPGKGADSASVTVDTSIKNVDASKLAKARIFPGLVCSDEPRLMNIPVTLDLDYFFVDREQLRMSVIPQPQFSTGYYAAPGELVIVDVPEGINSLTVQIGAWTYDASAVQNSQRDPVIFLRDKLVAGRNYFRNLYGGPIYIIASRPISTPVTLRFTNVVKMPDFILGQTNEAEWKSKIQSSCVPWLELRSENMIFTVPREYCVVRNISNLDAVMKQWDDAINYDYYQWIGLKAKTTGADTVDQAPLLPWRAVLDITMPPGAYGISGYPFRAQNDFGWFGEWTNLSILNISASWGTFHEIGHNHQQGQYWSWSSLGEVTNNLFIFKNSKRLGVYPAKHTIPVDDLNSKIAPAVSWATGAAVLQTTTATTTRNFDGTDAAINDPFARLSPFLQIFDKIPANFGYPGQPDGWGFMAALYQKARRANRISVNDQQKRDFVYETLCDYTRQDWRLFFKAWGIAVSNIALSRMAQYPLMTQKIWEYNPITRVGGDSKADIRFLWAGATANSFATNEGASNGVIGAALDGSFTTYWHSNYGTGTGPTATPYIVTIDLGRSAPITGFSAALRQSGTGVATGVKEITVEVSDDNANWRPVTFSTSGTTVFTMNMTQGLQTFNLSTPVNVRYFRYRIPNAAANNNNGASSALSEINIVLQ